MKMDLKKLKIVRAPHKFSVGDDSLRITTMPHTDLWQRTYYNFRNDSAPLFLFKSSEEFFSFSVKTDFRTASHRFDQCGIVIYQDSENWLKSSVEYENQNFAHLGCVVTNNGYSDWSTQEISVSQRCMWYRLSRRKSDYRVESSIDGVTFSQIRICHLEKGDREISFGVYACSPEDSSFEAVFTDFAVGECKWPAHDGQKPDEDLQG